MKTRIFICILATLLGIGAVLLVLAACQLITPTPTESPVSPPPTPPVLAAQAANDQVTVTLSLWWDEYGMMAASQYVPYRYEHLWKLTRAADSTVIAEGEVTNSLATSVPTDTPGTGQFDGAVTWHAPLDFIGRAYLWERGCWKAVACPTDIKMLDPASGQVVTDCVTFCVKNVPKSGIPTQWDEQGYWLTDILTGTREALPHRLYFPTVLRSR